MFTLAILVISLVGDEFGVSENHAAQIKVCIPALKGHYRDTWGITGKQVKTLLGAPSHIQTITLQSGRTWHYCWCDYEKLGLRVTLYAENRLVWAVPGAQSLPEDWEVLSVVRLKTAKGK